MFALVRLYAAPNPEMLTVPLSAIQNGPASKIVFVQLTRPIRSQNRPSWHRVWGCRRRHRRPRGRRVGRHERFVYSEVRDGASQDRAGVMIASVLEFSLRQRILVLGLACLLSIAGIVAFQSIPIDAYPDVTNIQVQVLTDAPGWSPVEVERFVTYPLELQMTGLPGHAEIRSLSKFISQVTVVFQDNVDIYFARQLVLERMIAAKNGCPKESSRCWPQ